MARSSLNILFLQNKPCIRNYKMATALKGRGHKVSLAYTDKPLSRMYPKLSNSVYYKNIRIKTYEQLRNITKDYDLVHSHNEPDNLTVEALAGYAPVIHDTHDLISLRAGGDAELEFVEGEANRGAAGLVYTTPYQEAEARTMYGIDTPSLVLYNYVSAGDLPDAHLSKLSEMDGNIHIVYEGGIRTSGHRDFSCLFQALAEKGVHIHIYPVKYRKKTAKLFSDFPAIHYYKPVSPKRIIKQMSRYDFGIIPFNLEQGNKRFLDSTIANKLFEYLAAGLPVLASPLQSYIDYFEKNPVGCVYDSADDILEKIPLLNKMRETVDFSKQIFTYESEIQRLEEYYYYVLDNTGKNKTNRSAPEPDQSGSGLKNASNKKKHSAKTYNKMYKSGGYNGEYLKHYSKSIYIDIWKKALDWIKEVQEPSVIDIGCGAGQFASLLFDNGLKRYKGIDFSKTAVKRARVHGDFFIVGDFFKSDLFESVYNIAVLLEVLEHVERDRELLVKIRPGTRVIFSVPNFDSKTHMRKFESEREVRERYKNVVNIKEIRTFNVGGESVIYLADAQR